MGRLWGFVGVANDRPTHRGGRAGGLQTCIIYISCHVRVGRLSYASCYVDIALASHRSRISGTAWNWTWLCVCVFLRVYVTWHSLSRSHLLSPRFWTEWNVIQHAATWRVIASFKHLLPHAASVAGNYTHITLIHSPSPQTRLKYENTLHNIVICGACATWNPHLDGNPAHHRFK